MPGTNVAVAQLIRFAIPIAANTTLAAAYAARLLDEASRLGTIAASVASYGVRSTFTLETPAVARVLSVALFVPDGGDDAAVDAARRAAGAVNRGSLNLALLVRAFLLCFALLSAWF
jgi:nicotinic acid phosphoribosyltransferase